MTQRDYSWRYGKSVVDGLVRDARRDEVLEALSAAGPQAVYAGLLAYALPKKKANGQPWNVSGWCAHAFLEIFGAWPRSQDRSVKPQPLPNFLIEEWVAGRKHKARPRQPDLFHLQQ
jgi:hypothetical protein